MRHPLRLFRLAIALAFAAAALPGCDGGDPDSIYDPSQTGSAAPTVSAVSPAGVVLAGIDEVTITGTNFSAVPEENLVYFEDGAGGVARAEVLSATSTQLVVRAPNFPGADITVRVSVLGAPDYSNATAYPLTAAVVRFGDVKPSEEAFGIASDPDGNAYVAFFNEGTSSGVQLIPPTGVRDPATQPYFATTFPWTGLAFNELDSRLYGARGIRALFALPAGENQQTFGVAPNGFSFFAITTDAAGNLWVGGNHSTASERAIVRIDPSRTLATFPFAARVRDLVVFEGALYAVGEDDTASRVWRFDIDAAGELGAPQELATIAETATSEVIGTALAVAADGTVYVGTSSRTEPVRTIDASGALATLYPGVLSGPVTGLAWGAGSSLYMVRGRVVGPTGEVVVRPDILQIETRRPRGASVGPLVGLSG